ncbi:relaxase [Sphingopyxis sp. BSNA05]|uniref:relaxase/mobilization nuclease domain-containing protein n=1 Tax=Sphingopyxis sp. BSNA05 TaxID=1236614 RepID=UPI00156421CB|nr:relaxase/mobilization nuclease domain-containing protein [Sphingopyxis sp. BSNA05]NRD90818.1 relaxase [Sphingopyxis sp. BSNA05]
MRFKIPSKQPAAFKSSALYLAGRTKGLSTDRVAWMEARNLETTDPLAAATIMEATAAQNLRCKRPVYHFVLSFDPKDARRGKLPPEVLREIAGEAIERMGLTEHQMLVYAHKDTKHPHMHFLINRVHSTTGKAFDRHNDGRRLTELCREIARERELNIPRDKERIRELEKVDDFDLVESLDAPTEGEYWQAKREEREPQIAMGKDEVKALREKVQGHFYNAKDWHDLTARLGAQGVFLQRKGQGLVLAKGERFAKLSQMGKSVRLAELEDRFGERFDVFMAERMKDLARDDAPEAQIPGYENMTPAEQRAAKRYHDAKLAVDRKKGDPVLELDAADYDYRYWAGVETVYRAGERRISRLERDRGWLKKTLPNYEAREMASEAQFNQSLFDIFRNPEKAAERWLKLEQTFGVADAERMVKKNANLLGRMNGARYLGVDTEARGNAKRAFRKLHLKRRRWQEQQLKLGHHRDRIEANRRALRIALNDFAMLRLRADVPFELREIMREKAMRRAKALTRATDKAILASNLAEDRKMELLRARRTYMERKRERERDRDYNRTQGLDYLDR